MSKLKRIPNEIVEQIRNKVDIVEVISHYLPLTKKGKSYKCVCPFHDDHDPSLSISSEKQIYHCFVCGSGGNVFTFVSKYENLSFQEAVLKVAEFANIKLDLDSDYFVEKKEDPHLVAIHKVLQETINFCSYELESVNSKSVRQYLYNRGLSDAIIKKFEIGYNPKENRLYHFLHAKKYLDSDILAANLVWNTNNGFNDVFSNRIMIPIHDANGKPIGFTARRVDAAQQAKYLNTSETDVFKKGTMLFNYHRAKTVAKKVGKIILVEGAMDVLAFEKVGIEYSVATLGTACTKEQLKLLKYLGARVILAYDGDKAGQDATYKFYKSAQNENLNVEIMDNKYQLDPDEIIETYGKDELIAISNKTMSWIDFLFEYLEKKYDLKNYSEKKEYAKEIASEIENLSDDFEKDSYFIRLKQITQFDLTKKKEVSYIKKEHKKKVNVLKYPSSGKMNAQYQILSLMLISKSACEYYRNELGFLIDKDANSLALYIVDYYRSKDVINIADFINYILEDDVRNLLLQIIDWELALHEYNENVMVEAVSSMKKIITEEKIKTLKERNNQVNDPIEKAKIAEEIISLKRVQGGINNGQKN